DSRPVHKIDFLPLVVEDVEIIAPGKQVLLQNVAHHRLLANYFFGRVRAWLQRLQRTRWLLILPPHLGQRRELTWRVNLVRGRVFMADLENGTKRWISTPVYRLGPK